MDKSECWHTNKLLSRQCVCWLPRILAQSNLSRKFKFFVSNFFPVNRWCFALEHPRLISASKDIGRIQISFTRSFGPRFSCWIFIQKTLIQLVGYAEIYFHCVYPILRRDSILKSQFWRQSFHRIQNYWMRRINLI